MNAAPDTPFPARLDLAGFFVGRTTAWGLVLDRRGRVRRRFRVEIDGAIRDGRLRLDEGFLFDDGMRERRVWEIETEGARCRGRAGDVVGTAEGEIAGPALTWRYELMLPVGRRRVRVRFDDLMALADREVMLSRATIRKFGLRVADVIIAFRRDDDLRSRLAA